jgi:hypothetical protein
MGMAPASFRSDYRDIRERDGIVLLGDFLGGRASVERGDESVQRNPGAADPDHTVGGSLNRNSLWRRVQFP